MVSQNKVGERAESKQTYPHDLLDNIIVELVRRFGAIQSDTAVAVNATHPDSTMFMETTAVKPLCSGIGITDDHR